MVAREAESEVRDQSCQDSSMMRFPIISIVVVRPWFDVCLSQHDARLIKAVTKSSSCLRFVHKQNFYSRKRATSFFILAL